MPTASWDLATTTARSRPVSSPGSPVVTTTLLIPCARASRFSSGCSAASIDDRLPAPIRPTSRVTTQAAAVTGTWWLTSAAWLVTSDG